VSLAEIREDSSIVEATNDDEKNERYGEQVHENTFQNMTVGFIWF
jgi:hypothetical protein